MSLLMWINTLSSYLAENSLRNFSNLDLFLTLLRGVRVDADIEHVTDCNAGSTSSDRGK